MVKTTLKGTYIVFLFALMWLPLIQMNFKIFKSEKLQGIRTGDLEKIEAFSLHRLFNADAQKNFERWFSQNFGLRGNLIKWYNQFLYSVFRESPTSGLGEGLILGKGYQVYGIHDVTHYLQFHKPFAKEKVEHLVDMLVELQTLLNQRGVYFVVLLSPNKAGVYPEYIPEYLRKMSKHKEGQDYETYIKLFKEKKLDYVDGIQILKDLKQKTPYPLFPRGGFHWNDYGAYHVLNGLWQRIEERLRKSLVRLVLNGVHVDHNGHGPDIDGASTLNLWYSPYDFICPRPLLRAIHSPHTFKPKILFQGGSYDWILLGLLGKFQMSSGLSAFFYYESEIDYTEERPENRLIKEIDWESSVFSKDVIVFELNLRYLTDSEDHLGQGFVRDALKKLKDPTYKTKYEPK